MKMQKVIVLLKCSNCNSIISPDPKKIKYLYCGNCGALDKWDKFVYKLQEKGGK